MEGELLSLVTAEKLARIDKAIKRCDELADEIEELEGSYSYMFVEIINILKGSDNNE